MSHSELSSTLKLAYQALLSIARGASERSAVQSAALIETRFVPVRRQTLTVVMEVLREQDLLDKTILESLSIENLALRAVCLLRLAAYAAKRCKNLDHLRVLERAIRSVAPVEYLPKLESLLGTITARSEHQHSTELSEFERIGLETHHPSWWVEYCIRLFGRATAIELLSSTPRPRYIRVNPLRNQGKTTLPTASKRLSSAMKRIPGLPGVFSLSGAPSTFSSFLSQGLFQIQDLASFLAVKSGNPKRGERVLELCAAPGGKTVALAQLMKNRGNIVSIDCSAKRMKTWTIETERLGVKIADAIIGDATHLGLQTMFDLVMIDPPCTGTGVFDRNPRMKWHLSPKSLAHYTTIQSNLLESASLKVDDNGRILYCTCSVTLEENEDMVRRFLKTHLDFETRPVLEGYGSPGLQGLVDCRRFYPHRDHTAGYFVALMQRVRNE